MELSQQPALNGEGQPDNVTKPDSDSDTFKKLPRRKSRQSNLICAGKVDVSCLEAAGYKIDYVNLKRRGWGQFNYGKEIDNGMQKSNAICKQTSKKRCQLKSNNAVEPCGGVHVGNSLIDEVPKMSKKAGLPTSKPGNERPTEREEKTTSKPADTTKPEKSGLYSCTENHNGIPCSFVSVHKKNLLRHQRFREPGQFACPNCPKKFSRPDDLKTHVEGGHEPIHCPHCPYVAKSRNTLNWHKRKCHGAHRVNVVDEDVRPTLVQTDESA